MSFYNELKRRNVIRVGFAYALFGWVIAQVADLALENFGAPDWVMKTLLFLMVVGFFAALFIAWAFELTPEGIKREKDVGPGQSVTHETGRKLDRIVIVVLVVAVGMLLFERFMTSDEPGQQISATNVQAPGMENKEDDAEPPEVASSAEPSVAVLPFVNMSSDPEQEFFSDGIAEEILNVLTRIPNLKVAARTSSFQFKGKNLDIAKIGQQLQVNHVLEGSVRKAGATLRITAQLIEAESGFHLWSATFDRQLEDVFAIQDEIAAAIAQELRARLTTELDKPSTVVAMEAYELYLKGRSLVAARGEANLFEAIDILKTAIEIDPAYAPALATLAKAYAVLPWFSNKNPAGELREQAREWSSKALETDPQNAEALATMAIVLGEIDLNWEGARRLLERALQSNPGSVAANNFMGDLALRTGDLINALKYESRAAELDPLGTVQLTDLGSVYQLMGEYEKVINVATRALNINPKFFSAHRLLNDAYYFQGDVEQLGRVLQVIEVIPEAPDDIALSISMRLHLASGDRQQARKMLDDRILSVKNGEADASGVAFMATVYGDFDAAAGLLMQAYNEKDGTWIYPVYVRLPEQAPDSAPWQEFWRLPGPDALAEIRRSHGLNPQAPKFGEGAKQ